MSIAFDSVSSKVDAGPIASVGWDHTCLGSDRLLLVCVSYNSTTYEISTVTYGGVALALSGKKTKYNGSVSVEIWYKAGSGLPTGTNAIVVTFAGAVDGINAGAASWNGVDPSTPLGSFVHAEAIGSLAASVIVPSAEGEVVQDCLSHTGGAGTALPTVGADQTQRWASLIATYYIGAGSSEPGAASVTMSWTLVGASPTWVLGAVPIKPSTRVEGSAIGRYDTIFNPSASFVANYSANGLLVEQSFEALYDAVQQPDAYYTLPLIGGARVRQQ